MKEFGSEKIIFDKMTALRTQLFPYMAFVYAWIVPLWADHIYGFCICMDSAFMGRSTPTTAFDGTI